MDNETGSKQSGRHPVNVGHLVMGVAFLGLLTIWALIISDTVTGDDVRWLLPVPWVVAGVAGLAVIGLRQLPEPQRTRGWQGRPDRGDEDASTLEG